VTTDDNGQAIITIAAGSVEGEAHITATCEGVSSTLTVTVSAQAPVCGADNLEACTTQSDCEAAGG